MLDILTEKGQESLRNEHRMISLIESAWKDNGITIVQTDKDKACDCDGFLIQKGIVAGLFESKCRNLTLEQLKIYETFLITYNKLERCKTLSKSLQIPFFIFVYLIPDDIILYWTVARDGKYCFKFEIANTLTQRTINGGSTIRENAFLHIKNSKILK